MNHTPSSGRRPTPVDLAVADAGDDEDAVMTSVTCELNGRLGVVDCNTLVISRLLK